MAEKYLFDLTGEVNKFLRGLKDPLSSWIITAKTCDGIFKLIEKGKKYDVFSNDADFNRYGVKVLDALKKAGAEYSVTLLGDGASGKFAAAARFLTGDVIALGDKKFISATVDYAKSAKKTCYAVLTDIDFDGLFSKSGEADNPLKAVIIDPEILVKGSLDRYPAAYAFAAVKSLDLIDYKLSVILKEKPFDEFYFLKARFLSAMLKNAFRFSNYHDVILYVALLGGVISALSCVYDGGGKSLKKAFTAEYVAVKESDCALYALIVGANAYHFTFANDLRLGVLPENYNADISSAATLFGCAESDIRKNFEIPASSSLAAKFRAVNAVRGKLLLDSGEILTALKTYVSGYEALTGEKFDESPFSYEKTKRAVIASAYLGCGVTAPALLIEAGVFAATE